MTTEAKIDKIYKKEKNKKIRTHNKKIYYEDLKKQYERKKREKFLNIISNNYN